MEVRGRDQVTGLPKIIQITSSEITEAMQEPLQAVVSTVRATLEKTPPELAADIIDRGMVLAGGGASLANWRAAAARASSRDGVGEGSGVPVATTPVSVAAAVTAGVAVAALATVAVAADVAVASGAVRITTEEVDVGAGKPA